MVTVKSTTDVTLNTPAEIISYLQDSAASDRFKSGDVVRITDRSSIPISAFSGDVGIVVGYDAPGAPYTSVRGLYANGVVTNSLVPSDILELYTPED